MKRYRFSICLGLLLALLHVHGIASADIFEREYGLRPAVVLVKGDDSVLFTRAMEDAVKTGAKGLLGLPPAMIFGRFPPGTGAKDFEGIEVNFLTDPADIDPMEVDVVTLKVARGLFEERNIMSREKLHPLGSFNDVVLEIPPELIERTAPEKAAVRRSGSPVEISGRAINQNSEFLIGNILINVIIPESTGEGQSEDWTDDEIGNALRDMMIGLSQYEQATHWVPLMFQVNCPDFHRRVNVSREPIEGNMDTDPEWIIETYRYLSAIYGIDMPERPAAPEAAHIFNSDLRSRHIDENGDLKFDWVFGVFICDASENGCWLGGEAEYAAYAYLGGPYLVCCYPACDFGTGLNFAHVFTHEMAHIFWAGDEYDNDGATDCRWRGGYLDYINGNSYRNGCGAGYDCIMNTALLDEPLPICRFTMGQIGLADDNNPPNSIPDIYEVIPSLDAEATMSDTTYTDDFAVTLRVEQVPVPSRNTRIPEEIRIDYAPEIKSGEMRINNGFWEPLYGKWTGFSSKTFYLILREGLMPGENRLYFRATNIVSLSGVDSLSAYYVGIRYFEQSAMADIGEIEVRWKTASEIFGADFELFRRDRTVRSEEELLRVIDGESAFSDDDRYRRYSYIDDSVEPGHTYSYRVVGTIDVVRNGVPRTLTYESRDLTETAIVPPAGNFVSPTIPNPTDDRGSTFSIDVPKSYYDPSGTTSRDIMLAPMAEAKTDVLVTVYDVSGRQIREVYNLSVFGGQILTMTWDGLDDGGKQVAAGVYFMKVTAGPNEQVQKIVIIR